MTRCVAIVIVTGLPLGVATQSPHAANPERPTVATHAYTVAPGYVELEQGVRAQGFGNVRDQTSWEFNLKIGVAPPLQLGLFGTGYNRTGQGNGSGGWQSRCTVTRAAAPDRRRVGCSAR